MEGAMNATLAPLDIEINCTPTPQAIMSTSPKQNDWSKPAAMAIPEGGYFKDKIEQGRYGPIFPKTPACYGFTIIAKIKPGRVDAVREYGKTLEKAVAGDPHVLAVLKLH